MSFLDKFKVSAKQSKPVKTRALGVPVVETNADDRLLEIMERERLPSDVNQIMASAINGDLRYQGVLIESMMDTWPRLQGNINEITGGVAKNLIEIEPFAVVGEDPTKSAIDKAAFIKQSLDAMEVDYIHGDKDIQGTVKGIAESYFTGHSVQEVIWETNDRGTVPKCIKQIPWRNFGYPYHNGETDRLMLNRNGDFSFNNLVDFPEYKFIVAIKKGHTGHASQAAPIRALMTYWLGSIYGLKWLLNFSQIYGVPLRWANYTDSKDVGVITNMMKKMGSSGWGIFPDKTKIEIKEAKTAAGNLPQQALIDNADKACDIFILGQTLTSDVGSSGSQALGNVHNEIRLDLIDSAGAYVAKVLKGSIIKDMLTLNYGDASEMPTVTIKSKRSKDEKGLAETAKILTESFPDLLWSEEQIREKHGIAKPINDEDALKASRIAEKAEEKEVASDEVVETKASLATIQAAEVKSNIDKLSSNVLEGLSGVAIEWLGGVKPSFDRLAALAASGNVTDEDFLEVVKAAKVQLPELFDKLNTESLQKAFEESNGTAIMAGVEDSLSK